MSDLEEEIAILHEHGVFEQEEKVKKRKIEMTSKQIYQAMRNLTDVALSLCLEDTYPYSIDCGLTEGMAFVIVHKLFEELEKKEKRKREDSLSDVLDRLEIIENFFV